jgi:hypothetical protein
MHRTNPPLIHHEGTGARVAPTAAARKHGWRAAFRFLGLIAVGLALIAGPGIVKGQAHAQPTTQAQPSPPAPAPAVHYGHHRAQIKRVRKRIHRRHKRAKNPQQSAAAGHAPAASASHAPPHVAAAPPAHAPVVHPPESHPKVATAPAPHAPAVPSHAAANPTVQTAVAHPPEVTASVAPVHHHLAAPSIHRETVHIHSADGATSDHTPATPSNASASSESAPAIAQAPEKPKWPVFDHPTDASILWDSRGLTIDAANSSLQQILKDVSTATGVKVEGLSSDERVFGTYGPGLARDVLSELLQGSGYNMIMVGDLGQGAPRKITLSVRQAANRQPALRPAGSQTTESDDEEPEEQPAPQEPPIRPGFQPGGPPRTPQQIMQEMQQRQQRIQEQQEQQLPQQPQD